MKNIIKIFRITILTGLVVSLCTCKKDKFLNVNGNPNFPSTITVNLALPTIEANTGYMLDCTRNTGPRTPPMAANMGPLISTTWYRATLIIYG